MWLLQVQLADSAATIELAEDERQARKLFAAALEGLNAGSDFVEVGESFSARRALVQHLRLVQEPARQTAWQLHAQLGDGSVSVDLTDDEQAARAAFAEARRKLGTTSAAKYVALTSDLIVERSTVQYVLLTAHELR